MIIFIFSQILPHTFHGLAIVSGRLFISSLFKIISPQGRKCCTIMGIFDSMFLKQTDRLFKITAGFLILVQGQTGICQIRTGNRQFKISILMTGYYFQCLKQALPGRLKLSHFLIQKTYIIVKTGHQHIIRRQHPVIHLHGLLVAQQRILQSAACAVGIGNVKQRGCIRQSSLQPHLLCQNQRLVCQLKRLFHLAGLPVISDQFI